MKIQLLIVIALVVGGMLALQGMINAQLGKSLAHPLQASFVSFSVGVVGLARTSGCVLLLAGLYLIQARA